MCSQLEGAILRPEEHIVASKFQSGGNVKMVVSAFPQSLPVSLPLTGMMEPSFAAGDRSRVYSLVDLVWQKVRKKAAIMPTPARGVSSRLHSNIGARVGNVREKAWQQVS